MTEIGMTESRIVGMGRNKPHISIGRQFGLHLAAFSIGVVVAVYLFPLDYLLDRWAWWAKAHGDNTAGLIGYLYFAQDEWRWPLFHTRLLNPPAGVNIIYTDPVPIAALLGKIFFKLTGVLPIYMGAWTILSYGLQSLLSWLIFRQLGLRPALAMAGAAIVSVTPAFIFRFAHIGLVAHFIILAAILFYLRTVTVASRREMALSAVAIGGILFVNPYLLAMSAPIFISGLMEATWRGRISWREAAAIVALMVAVVGALAFAFGIIGQGGLPAAGGFGLYSMNLLSPVVPQFSIFPGHSSYRLDKTGGQYEGFNYLGAGTLLLVLCAIAFRFGSVRELVTRHKFLVATLIGLTLFAASSKIYVGSWYVVDLRYETLPVLSLLTSVFRASGRFFWPAGYVLVIGAVVVLARSKMRRPALLLVPWIIMIQLIDISPLLSYVKAATSPRTAQIDSLTRAASAHSEIALHPIFHCARPSDRGNILQLQLIAARANIPVNGAYINRIDVNCPASRQQVLQKIDAESVTSNPLIVIFKDSFPASVLKDEAAADFACRDATFAFACSRQRDHPAFVALGGEIEPLRMPLGTQLGIGQGGSGLPFLGAGWSAAEGHFRWLDGDVASLIGLLEQSVCNTLTLHASVLPFSYGDYVVRHAKVILNGQSAGEITLPGPGSQVISHSIALGGRCTDTVKLELRFEDLRSPKDLGMNADPRRISWGVQWFSLTGD
jgi:Family of unknown function (DUF6311)